MIKQAIIAAGGFGTRLRPYTETIPKQMISVAGKPMLEWRMEQFKKYGVTEFFFTLNYLPDAVKDYFGDGSRFGVSVHYFTEAKPLDTFGAVKLLENRLEDDFFFGYGDIIAFLDYSDMEKRYREKDGAIGIQHVAKTEHYKDADVVELDSEAKFIAIYPKPHQEKYSFPAYRMQGTCILNRKILQGLDVDRPYNLGNEVLPMIVSSGKRFYGYESDAYITWIDTLDKWKEVDAYFKVRSAESHF